MIDKETKLTPGLIVRHDDGLRHQVEDVRRSAGDYEQAHQLGGMVVNFVQLDLGSFTEGTRWSEDEEGFRQHFTVEPASRFAGRYPTTYLRMN